MQTSATAFSDGLTVRLHTFWLGVLIDVTDDLLSPRSVLCLLLLRLDQLRAEAARLRAQMELLDSSIANAAQAIDQLAP
jgi:hypothetical protein